MKNLLNILLNLRKNNNNIYVSVFFSRDPKGRIKNFMQILDL